MGMADSTVVMFFSDHGEMGSSHGRFQKCSPYAESLRVPWLMRLPGVLPAGASIDQPANLIDIFPTSATLCGVPLPDHVQGLDLTPAAESGDTAPRTAP